MVLLLCQSRKFGEGMGNLQGGDIPHSPSGLAFNILQQTF